MEVTRSHFYKSSCFGGDVQESHFKSVDQGGTELNLQFVDFIVIGK